MITVGTPSTLSDVRVVSGLVLQTARSTADSVDAGNGIVRSCLLPPDDLKLRYFPQDHEP